MASITTEGIGERNLLEKTLAVFRYHPGIPLSRRDKEKVLLRYRTSVDRYLPLIQERTGIDMGKVGVDWIGNSFRLSFKHHLNKALGEAKNKVQRGALLALASGFYPIMELSRMYEEEFTAAHYNERTQTIGISFGFTSKLILVEEVIYGFSQVIDENTLHELTHHLWNKIHGRISMYETPKLLVEGFATYGEQNWFADLLPEGRSLRRLSDEPRAYRKGRDTIEKLVQKHGEKILLEIPVRWKELESDSAA